MKNKILLILGLVLVLVPFKFVGAYEINTHQALTQKIIEIYNKYNDPKITPEQTQWLIKGSGEEDLAPRWINHFYDPIYKNGWSGEKQGDIPQETVQKLSKIFLSSQQAVSSIDWLHNQNLQNQYLLYGGNQTYERALKLFAYSENILNKTISESPIDASFEKTFEALGENLHLLEDLGVPAHTRNDTHADVFGSSDYSDPYEKWASENPDLSFLNNLNPNNENYSCATIDDCFLKLAKYTNENFYSKDTINDNKYKILNTELIQSEIDKDIYERKDFYGNLYPFLIYQKYQKQFTITNNLIHQSYFTLLSKQVVLAGVEALKIFNRDAQKEVENVQYPQHILSLKECNIPILCRDVVFSPLATILNVTDKISSAASSIKDFFANIFTTADSGFTPIEQIALNNEIKTDSSQTSNNQQSQTKIQNTNQQISNIQTDTINNQKITQDPVKENTTQTDPLSVQIDPQSTIKKTTVVETSTANCKFITSQSPSHNKIIFNEIAWMGTTNSASDEWIELKNISNNVVDLKNWQIIDKDEQIKINLSSANKTRLNPGEFILLERTDDNTVANITADLIYVGGLSNTDENLRLFDGNCVLMDEVSASPSWPAGKSDIKATMERDLSGFSWHDSAVIGGTPKNSNSSPVIVSSGGGGGGTSTDNQQTTNNQQSTSTETSPNNQPQKILITEIRITGGTGKTEDDFIELYNPNNFEVNLKGYRLVKRTKTGTSDTGIKSWTSDVLIPANSYYLWANSGYVDIPVVADIITSATISNDNGVAIRYGLEDTGTIIDSVGWGEAQNIFIETNTFVNNPSANQSIQRKFQNNAFVDTNNNVNDFEIKTCPSPKSQSTVCQQATDEATSTIATVSNFNIEYSSSTLELVFNWDQISSSTASTTYKIFDISDASSSLMVAETSSTTARFSINEVGRDYNFSIQAFEEEIAVSEITTSSVSIPSLLSDLYFFRNPLNLNEYFIEGYYEKYPFVPDRYELPMWKVLIFYLNQDAPKNSIPANYEPGSWGSNISGALPLAYKNCASNDDNSINGTALVLPDAEDKCSVFYGGIRNSSYEWDNLEDNHFIVKIASSTAFNDNDFISVAFYAFSGNDQQTLVAVDKTLYKLKTIVDWQQSPQFSTSTESISFNFSRHNSKLLINWPKAADTDSVDSLITYEIQYVTGGDWQEIHATGTEKIVAPGDNFSITVRAKDNFNNYSQQLTGLWKYPETIFYINQTNSNEWSYNFGQKSGSCGVDCRASESLQNIIPQQNFQFNKVVLKLWHYRVSDISDLRLRVYEDNSGLPDYSKPFLGETIVAGLLNPDINSEIAFSFNNLINVEQNKKYWLALDVAGYSDSSGYSRNTWKNAISVSNDYQFGDGGYCSSGRYSGDTSAGCGSANPDSYHIPFPSNADWYMKIGLE